MEGIFKLSKSIFIIIVFFVFMMLSLQSSYPQTFKTVKEWEHYFNTRKYKLNPIEGIWMSSNKVKYFDEGKVIRIDTNKNIGKYAIYKNVDTSFNERVISYKTYCIEKESQYLQITFYKEKEPNEYSLVLEYLKTKIRVYDTAYLRGNTILRFNYEKPREQWKNEMETILPSGRKARIMMFSNQALMKSKQIWEHNWKKLYPKINQN
ncbi:MAG: hypothetical protein NTX61_05385 [Bacteroidetes bacterium]|nr:hypothetical protein [Bacteroidota bacterium]